MQKHEETKIEKKVLEIQNAVEKVNNNPQLTFQPAKPKSVPNFLKEHKKFEKQLEKKKTQIKITKIAPFKIKDMENQKDVKIKEVQLSAIKENVIVQNEGTINVENKLKNIKSKDLKPKLTLKAQNQLKISENLKLEIEKNKLNEKLDKEKKEREFKEKAERFRQKFNFTSQLSNEEKWEILAKEKLKERKQREGDYQLEMQKLQERLDERDFYMERLNPELTKKQQVLEKIKTLLKAFDVFISKNPYSDVSKVFSKEELKLIKEGRFLKKNGYLK